MMARIAGGVLAAFLFLCSASAFAQGAIQQAGAAASGHALMFITNGVATDAGAAAGGGVGVGLSELLLTARGSGAAPFANAGTGPLGTNQCDYDAPVTNAAGYHYFCLSPNAQGGGLLAYGAGGGAAALPLNINVNGTSYAFPFTLSGVLGPNSSVVNNIATWNNALGSVLKDSGVAVGSLAPLASPTFTGTVTLPDASTITSAAGLTLGHAAIFTGQTITGGTYAGVTLSGTTVLPGNGQITSAGLVGVGGNESNSVFYGELDQNAGSHITVRNTSTGSAAQANVYAQAAGNGGDGGLNAIHMFEYGPNTAVGMIANSEGGLYTNTPGMNLVAGYGPIKFSTNSSFTEIARFDTNGRLLIGTTADADLGQKLQSAGGALVYGGEVKVSGYNSAHVGPGYGVYGGGTTDGSVTSGQGSISDNVWRNHLNQIVLSNPTGTNALTAYGALGVTGALTTSAVVSANGALAQFGLTTPGHVATGQTTPPALTSCGTTPAITGTDTAGVVTMGTTATGCVITFNVAYSAVPYCVVAWQATPLASQSYTITASAITTVQTSTSNNKLNYMCIAQSGG